MDSFDFAIHISYHNGYGLKAWKAWAKARLLKVIRDVLMKKFNSVDIFVISVNLAVFNFRLQIDQSDSLFNFIIFNRLKNLRKRSGNAGQPSRERTSWAVRKNEIWCERKSSISISRSISFSPVEPNRPVDSINTVVSFLVVWAILPILWNSKISCKNIILQAQLKSLNRNDF